jgi:hypothetical protein
MDKVKDEKDQGIQKDQITKDEKDQVVRSTKSCRGSDIKKEGQKKSRKEGHTKNQAQTGYKNNHVGRTSWIHWERGVALRAGWERRDAKR